MTPRFRCSSTGTREISPRLATHSPSARLWRRASAPAIQRSGCGRPGKSCTGGSGAKATWRTPRALRSQLASASRAATARCEEICSTTSLTPVTMTASSANSPKSASAAAARSACARSKACVCAVVRPERATSCQHTRRPLNAARCSASGGASASHCSATPTPAAEESPAIKSVSDGPRPTSPLRAPSASGRRGKRARVRKACATSSGLSSSLAVSDMADRRRGCWVVGEAERAKRCAALRTC